MVWFHWLVVISICIAYWMHWRLEDEHTERTSDLLGYCMELEKRLDILETEKDENRGKI